MDNCSMEAKQLPLFFYNKIFPNAFMELFLTE